MNFNIHFTISGHCVFFLRGLGTGFAVLKVELGGWVRDSLKGGNSGILRNQVSFRFLGSLGLSRDLGKESLRVRDRVLGGEEGNRGVGKMGFLPPAPMAYWRT